MESFIKQQGEVRIVRIKSIPEGIEVRKCKRDAKGYIISHSENGNHHLLTDGDVIERTSNVPLGMQIFYAILDEPEQFIQDAASPHDGIALDPGIYAFKVSREFNPFTEKARRVAD